MMKVLYVNDNLRLPAGITMVIKNIIDNCQSSDIEFSILTIESDRNNALGYFQGQGVRIYYMPGTTTTSTNNRFKRLVAKVNVFSLFKIRRFFLNFFRENSFDVVHSHFAQIDKLMFPVAKNSGVKCCISHSHSSKLSESYIRAIRNKIICNGLIDIADYCAACSDKAGIALFGKRFLDSNKRLIINNGIRVPEFKYNDLARVEIRRRYNIPADTFVIGHVGRLNKVKNQSFLIDVFSILDAKVTGKYVLMLVGSGECEVDLKNKVKKNGLEGRVIFAGAQTDIASYLCAFDIFVMPSLHEGLGIAAIEAQATGLECILSTTIPSDVNLTDIVFLSINDIPAKWAEQIIKMPKERHLDYNQKVLEAGYDINDVCANLCQFYMSISQS